MPVPRVAILGRPNVGKSSLLNMIAGDKVSIVDPTAGTTRDRVSAIVDLAPPGETRGQPARMVEIVDTGGYGAYTEDGQRFNEVGADLASLSRDIERQIGLAIESADIVLFCIDAQAGITPLDQKIAKMLREGKLGRGKRGSETARQRDRGKAKKNGEARDGATVGATPAQIRVVATKVDGPKWEAHGLEFAALGFGEPLLCSSKSNYFRRDFLDELYRLLPPASDEQVPPVDLKLAIIGKRNAGKSSLVNAMAGEERVIVSEIAGTTRDAIDVRFEIDGRSLLAIDTAGLRRKKSFANRIEWWAFDRAQRAIDRADVVFLLIDATEPLSQVDEQLAMLVQKAYKPCVLVVNKWDLVKGRKNDKGRPIGPGDYESYLRAELKGLAFAPVSFVSAETGLNLRQTLDLAFEIQQQAKQRVTTGQLNRLVAAILERSNPPSKLGTRAKCYYVAQVKVSPPTIVMVVNKPELFTNTYCRFLLNRFREAFPFGEVPIRLLVRARSRTLMRKGRGGVEPVPDAELTQEEIAEVESEATAAASVPAGDDAEAYFEDE